MHASGLAKQAASANEGCRLAHWKLWTAFAFKFDTHLFKCELV